MSTGLGNDVPYGILTPDQRPRVFISSTLVEMAQERVAARRAVESLRLIPVMFELGARPHPARSLYRAYLAQSHIFVGLYAERYGWVAPEESISGLEDEYHLSEGLPRLVYLRTPADREARLEALLDRVREDDTVSYRSFRDSEELERLLRDDLAVVLAERFLVGAQGERPDHVQGAEALGRAGSHQLPQPLTDLVGREAETAQVRGLLDAGARLVTLVGPGGIGKTRVALEVAHGVARAGREVAFVPLDAVRDPKAVLPAIGGVLGIGLDGSVPAAETLGRALRNRDLLLVLDNMEQVVESAPDVTALLQACPGVTVLATSRAGLRVRGEQQVPIGPLTTPNGERGDLDQYAAVRLFLERARDARPGLTLDDPAEAAAVAELTKRPSNSRIAVVVAAFMLDEGWDVTSVSVITPLRSLNSVGNAKQIIGRGLRLPVGQRVGVEELDRLDVVIVAQESLFKIKNEVKDEFGSTVPVERANRSRTRVPTTVPGSGAYDCLLARSPGVGDFEIPSLVVAHVSRPKTYPAEVRTSGNVLIDAATATVREMKLRSTASEVSIATTALRTWAPYLTDKEIQEFLEAVRPSDWAVSITALRKALEQYMAGCSFSWLAVPTPRSVLDGSLVCSSTRNPAAPRSAKSGWIGKDCWYHDWSKPAYSITQFDNEWEFEAAEFFDETPSVVWWLRNDPATLTVATPSHKRGHEPDFVVLDEEGKLHLIEIKGQGYWADHQRAVVPTLQAWAVCLTEAGQSAAYTTIPAENVTAALVGLLRPAN